MEWIVPLFDLSFNSDEKNAVDAVLESKWLTQGKKTKEFEDKFLTYLGSDGYAIAVSSCTAALHLSLMTLNIKPGDEVIVSGLTFVAAVNVVSNMGAKPVLADSKSYQDWNVSVDDIKKKITKKTKAIIIVHYAGFPCDMDEIVEVCNENNIFLIEDCAHAPGAEYKEKKCGVFGDISCFSFFSNKNLSTGEGGMIITSNHTLYEQSKLMRSHGMSSLTVERHAGKTISYDVLLPGLNYRIDEVRSAIGIEQLKKLEKNNKLREERTVHYYNLLEGITEIGIPFYPIENYKKSCYHIFPVLLPENIDRNKLVEYLKGQGVQTSIHYPSISNFRYYNSLLKDDIVVANEISRRVLTLPLYPHLSFDKIDYVVNNLKSGLG